MARNRERFAAANQELRSFLQRANEFADGGGSPSDGDIQPILARLVNLAPEVGDASRSVTLDAQLRDEIAEYVKNFRALQKALDKIRWIMLGRSAQRQDVKHHLSLVLNRSRKHQPIHLSRSRYLR